MKRISKRQALDVQNAIERELSWGTFREYVESQLLEKRNQIRMLTGDITKFLEREQLLGQVLQLETLISDFHNHVVHVITNNEIE